MYFHHMVLTTNIELMAVIERLRRLGGDDGKVEVKRAREGLPSSLWETISAFANAEGGKVLLGVEERAFRLTGVLDAALAESQLSELCANQLEPPVRASVFTVVIEDASIVVVEVPAKPRAQRPCHLRSKGPFAGSRIRVADGDRKLSEYEIALLLSEREQPRADGSLVVGAHIDDLDPALLAEFLGRLRASRSQLFDKRTDESILRLLSVVGGEGEPIPTLAGLLAFGSYPQQFFPQLNLTFVSYPNKQAGEPGPDGERFLDNLAIDGNIGWMLKVAVAALQRNMKRVSIVEGTFRTERWEYPIEALREAIVNAMVHRDYGPSARGAQVQIEMYPDRVVVRNAGGLYGPIEPNQLGLIPSTSARNQTLLKILEDAPAEPGRTVCENRGSGISSMRASLAMAGMKPPTFTDSISTFSVTLSDEVLVDVSTLQWIDSLSPGVLSSTQRIALSLLRGGVPLRGWQIGQAASASEGDALRALEDLRAVGLVTKVGSGVEAEYRLSSPAQFGPGTLTVRERVLAVLTSNPLSRSEISVMVAADPQAVSSALVQLRRAGQARLIGEPRSKNARWIRAGG
jgi:ATP-dependent DNA helicase RecG